MIMIFLALIGLLAICIAEMVCIAFLLALLTPKDVADKFTKDYEKWETRHK